MTTDALTRLDDLTPREAADVLHAYDSALVHGDQDDAFALAMGVFRGIRPDLPLSIVAAGLDMLLACERRA